MQFHSHVPSGRLSAVHVAVKNALMRAVMASTSLVAAGTALAQDAPPPTTADAAMEEVVVRGIARKYRAEEQTSATGLEMKLIDTPQAISVLTPEMMQIAGANSIYEATDMVPGLERGGQGYGLDRFVMRGNSVGTHRINGTRFGVGKSLEEIAMDRLEIVRGPATALYGVTGSFGGEINHVLKSPLQQFRSEVGVRGGDFDLLEGTVDITGPIALDGRVSGRLVGMYRDYGAPVDVVDVENEKSVVMGSLQFDFTESTSSRVWVYYSKLDEDPYDGGSLVQTGPGQLAMPDVPAGNWYFNDPRYARNDVTQAFAIADLQHNFANDWKFKTQAAVSRNERVIGEYFTFGPAGAYSLGTDEVYLYSYDQMDENEDFIWDVSLGGKFNAFGREHQFFTAVEYGTDLSPSDGTLFNSNFLGNVYLTEGGLGVFTDGSPIPLVDRATLTPRRRNQQGFEDIRGSLQLLINPIERLEILAGILWQNTKIESKSLIANSVVLPNPVVDRDSYTETVSRFGATYDLTDDHGALDDARLYISYSEGFNPNLNVVDGDGNALTTPQEMTQYEVGIKAEFFDGALGASIAVYDSELLNVPVSVNYLGEFGNAGSTLEGKRDIKGVEIEAVGEVLPGLNLAFNYAYTDGVISDPNFDFTTPIKTLPKNEGAIYASYEFLQGSWTGFRFGGAIIKKSDYSFVESLTNVDRFGSYIDGGHTRIDLNASYAPKSGPLAGFDLYLQARNITDEKIFVAKEDHPGFGITREDPKSITLGLRYLFGQR
jgi:outer membrane receptor for ferric coprogen and ferric-rhodotorulic acid